MVEADMTGPNKLVSKSETLELTLRFVVQVPWWMKCPLAVEAHGQWIASGVAET